MPLVDKELLTLPKHLSSPPSFSGDRATRSLVLCVCFVDRRLSFCPFLVIVLSVLLRFTDSDYPFIIFKLFLSLSEQIICFRRKANIKNVPHFRIRKGNVVKETPNTIHALQDQIIGPLSCLIPYPTRSRLCAFRHALSCIIRVMTIIV